jgi:hypothetical protein
MPSLWKRVHVVYESSSRGETITDIAREVLSRSGRLLVDFSCTGPDRTERHASEPPPLDLITLFGNRIRSLRLVLPYFWDFIPLFLALPPGPFNSMEKF